MIFHVAIARIQSRCMCTAHVIHQCCGTIDKGGTEAVARATEHRNWSATRDYLQLIEPNDSVSESNDE